MNLSVCLSVYMKSKASKSCFKKGNTNPNDHVHFCVSGCHGESVVRDL